MSTNWENTIDNMRITMVKLSSEHEDYNVDEEIGYITTAFANNWKLQKAEPAAIEHLLRQVASIGLTINPVHQFAFIQDQGVKTKEAGNGQKAEYAQRPVLNIEYKGLLELLTSSGAAQWVRADVVREGDGFEYRGPYEKPVVNVGNPFASERVKIIGTYAVAKLSDGEYFCEIMQIDELNEVQNASSGGGPWKNAFKAEMYKKSAIKRLYKTIPKNRKIAARMDVAIEASNKADGFDFERVDVIPLVKAIEEKDGFAIIDIMDSLDDKQKIDIWGGFAKGEKTSSKEAARNLMKDAFQMIADTVAELNEQMKSDDSVGALQLLGEMDIGYIKKQASPELMEWLGGLTEAA